MSKSIFLLMAWADQTNKKEDIEDVLKELERRKNTNTISTEAYDSISNFYNKKLQLLKKKRKNK